MNEILGITIMLGMIGLSVFSVMFVTLYAIYSVRMQQRSPWHDWAIDNNLRYDTGKFIVGPDPFVYGRYRGYKMRLTTLVKGWGQYSRTYTRLSLSGAGQNRKAPRRKMEWDGPLTVTDVSQLLNPEEISLLLEGIIQVEGHRMYVDLSGVETNIDTLQLLLDFLADVADNYLSILEVGSQAIPGLVGVANANQNLMKFVAHQLISDICEETTNRLGNHVDELVCPKCFK